MAFGRKISRRAFLKNSSLALASISLGSCVRPGTKKQLPNIILCMADDQGWGDMGYYDNSLIKTPVFDEMSRSCLRLDRFYAAAPVCSPTRASVLTGRNPNRAGVISWGCSMRPEEVSIAKIMKKAGYSTGHFGKWHLGGLLPDSKTSPKVAGFDKWVSALNFFDIDPWLSENGTPRQFTGESSEVTVDVAIDFIREQSVNDMPFFAVVWFGSPHVPHKGTEEDLALYADAPKDKQNFLAEMTALDRAVGKLRSALRDMNVADNTLFWYCSDNGVLKQGNAGGLRGLKGQMYEGGLRVPCLIEWPAKITGGRQSNMTASTMDIYPTLLELTGQKSAYQPLIDGESIAGLIEGKMTSRKKPIGFWYMGEKGVITRSDEILSSVATLQQACEKIPADHPAHGPAMLSKEWKEPANSYPGHSVWLDNEWKLHRIENKEGRSVRWELYNLEKDEAERNDVFSAQPEIADRMKAELKTWLKSVTDSIAGKDYPAEK